MNLIRRAYFRFFIMLCAGVLLSAAGSPQTATSSGKSSISTPENDGNEKLPFFPYPSMFDDDCYRAHVHDAADLCAQWRAALAAERAATQAEKSTIISIVGAVLSFVTVFGLIITIRQTNRALREARRGNRLSIEIERRARKDAISSALAQEEALKLAGRNATAAESLVNNAEQTAKRRLRAYVNVTSFEVVEESDNNFIVKVHYKNNGLTPAINCRAYFRSLTVANVDRYFDLDTPISFEERGSFVLPPGSVFNAIVPFPTDILPKIAAGEVVAFVNGWIRYDDVFGASHTTHGRGFSDSGNILSRGFGFCPAGNTAD